MAPWCMLFPARPMIHANHAACKKTLTCLAGVTSGMHSRQRMLCYGMHAFSDEARRGGDCKDLRSARPADWAPP